MKTISELVPFLNKEFKECEFIVNEDTIVCKCPQYEQKPRFTLKQLNAKLMQNLAVIIDHSVLQEAINRDYIECLPDLTGVVGASEYRLTAYGEKTLMEEG